MLNISEDTRSVVSGIPADPWRTMKTAISSSPRETSSRAGKGWIHAGRGRDHPSTVKYLGIKYWMSWGRALLARWSSART